MGNKSEAGAIFTKKCYYQTKISHIALSGVVTTGWPCKEYAVPKI